MKGEEFNSNETIGDTTIGTITMMTITSYTETHTTTPTHHMSMAMLEATMDTTTIITLIHFSWEAD